jgi:hypothetical protein
VREPRESLGDAGVRGAGAAGHLVA